jgi:aromatic ring-cleaving dioxygenase
MNYDVHVYWDNPKQREEAELIKYNLDTMGVVTFNMVDNPIGPHPLPMFEAKADDSILPKIEDLLAKIRKSCSVLIHKNTGSHMYDHTYGARWVGEPLALNLDFITKMMGHRF